MTVIYYFTSVSSNTALNKKQQRIELVLDGRKIKYEKRDIASCEDDKKKMRELIGDPKALAPQLFNDEEYCGDFTAFEEAVEAEELEKFLKL